MVFSPVDVAPGVHTTTVLKHSLKRVSLPVFFNELSIKLHGIKTNAAIFKIQSSSINVKILLSNKRRQYNLYHVNTHKLTTIVTQLTKQSSNNSGKSNVWFTLFATRLLFLNRRRRSNSQSERGTEVCNSQSNAREPVISNTHHLRIVYNQ